MGIVFNVGWWLFSMWVCCLGFGFGKLWVCAHSAQWEQAVRRLQLQVELQPPTWQSARLV